MSAHTSSIPSMPVFIPRQLSGDTFNAPGLIRHAVSLRPGPSKAKAALVAQFGNQYSVALAEAKRERRKRRAAEALAFKKVLSASERLSLDDFKAKCHAVLDNLRAMPAGVPKSEEQLVLELAQFGEWILHKGAAQRVTEDDPEPVQVAPVAEIIPARSAPSPVFPHIPSAERKGGRAANPGSIAGMEFTVAAQVWLSSRRVRLKPSTFRGYIQSIKMLSVYFQGMRLYEIHGGHLLEYQACRTQNVGGEWFHPTDALPTPWERKSGPSNTNHELNTLSQILRRAKLWGPLADDYKPLSPKGFRKPKVMSTEQKRLFYSTVASKPEWLLALWVAAITNNTTASGVELRNLTFADVHLDAPKPHIEVNPETAKCRNRGREVYLNANALAGMKLAMARARELGSFRETHYVFPFRLARNTYDVTRPASPAWLDRAWSGIREAIGIPWLTPHKLRHQCLTEMMESGAAPEQMRKIAGHLSREMTDLYTHNRMEKQAEVLDRLEPIPEILQSL